MRVRDLMLTATSTPLARVVGIMALVLCGIVASSPCAALDNPNAPNLVGVFNARCERYESTIRSRVSSEDIARAYGIYMRFLNQQLNQTYQHLLQQVAVPVRESLMGSERNWIRYRNAEDLFIETNWTPQTFGTSSIISRGDYRAAVVKQRVVLLMQYLRNYSSAPHP